MVSQNLDDDMIEEDDSLHFQALCLQVNNTTGVGVCVNNQSISFQKRYRHLNDVLESLAVAFNARNSYLSILASISCV